MMNQDYKEYLIDHSDKFRQKYIYYLDLSEDLNFKGSSVIVFSGIFTTSSKF